ncbi:hypothetical protein OCAR_6353 [Afipia carboxidovorans OM5]|nr:hypothetical protein OCAR_6353 [Afipia carboxidovorans OM5]
MLLNAAAGAILYAPPYAPCKVAEATPSRDERPLLLPTLHQLPYRSESWHQGHVRRFC